MPLYIPINACPRNKAGKQEKPPPIPTELGGLPFQSLDEVQAEWVSSYASNGVKPSTTFPPSVPYHLQTDTDVASVINHYFV